MSGSDSGRMMDWVSDAAEVVGSADQGDQGRGRWMRAAADVAAGECVVRSTGVAEFEQDLVSRVLGMMQKATKTKAEAAFLARMTTLTPLSWDGADARQRSQMEAQDAVFEEWKELLFPRLSVEEMRLVQMKLNLNAHEQGLFPGVAFFNHSCLPNCFVCLRHVSAGGNDKKDEEQEEVKHDDKRARTAPTAMVTVMEVRTLRDVKKGEELSISYLRDDMAYKPDYQRRAYLASRYFFDCQCDRCSGKLADERFLQAVRCAHCDDGFACIDRSVEPNDDVDQVLCESCGKRGTSEKTDRQQEVIMSQSAQADDADVLESDVLKQCDAILHKRHWLRVSVQLAVAAELKAVAIQLRQQSAQQRAVAQRMADHLRESLDAVERVVPANHAFVTSLLEDYAQACRLLGRDAVADEAMKRVVAARRMQIGY
eukprot:TRINITY_DN77127_c0_g1_i1.p1 TRINITY_DN77127_c0_g1~~TRINITY_DN77127_c0_g1_i1.p1  ORF type:complete len:427 (-),score=155.30 TRINITY_DN77127_c0_g1_i1:167-1447(-)